jgi:carbamoyltransferase
VKPSGEILSACALERLTRVKQDSRPPDPLLEKLPWERIETIAVSTDEFPWSPVDPRSRLHPTPLIVPRGEFLAHGQPFYDYLANLPKRSRFVCHQASHAACAFWLSGFDEALCLTYDGGMFNSPWFGGLYRASRAEGITALDRFASSHYAKITSLYSIVTALLGFTPNKHEGKITGLAAYGTPNSHLREILNELFTADYLKMEAVAEWFHAYSKTDPAVLFVHPASKAELLARFGGHSREDIAATLQAMAEEHVVEILRRARDLDWRSDAVCLSGGLFANVKINQRVKEFGFREIFISPPMTDDGTALGAALAVASEDPAFTPKPAAHMFLGPGYDSEQAQTDLRRFGLRFARLENPEECLAEHLARGAVIGIFQGRMEFGPRALGNRSILSQATDPKINGTLNARLRRTEFMPFAPITRVEDAPGLYIGLDGAEHAAEFMTITCKCTETMRIQSPAAVHVDGTARPQLVRRETHPLVHAILSAYQRRTGIPSLINTSFNVHEEPIVRSPSNAIQGFLETGIDFLYLEGGFLVSFAENLPAAVECMRHALAQPSQKERQLGSEIVVLTRAREQRITELESTAAERLAAMLDRDLLISRLHAELESRDHAIREIARRADALESAAGERWAAMVARDRVIATLQTELEALHQRLEAAFAAVAEQQEHPLEHDLEQLKALQSYLESERAALVREKDTLSQHLNRLEQEGLRDYLARWYKRHRPKPWRG